MNKSSFIQLLLILIGWFCFIYSLFLEGLPELKYQLTAVICFCSGLVVTALDKKEKS